LKGLAQALSLQRNFMSNRQIVMQMVSDLPEDTPLDEIARRVQFLAGLQEAETQADRGEGLPAENARALVERWASR
jgi:hypothetical protein